MPYKTLFFTQAALLALIAVVHISALQWYLYWQYLWLDLPVHFLGGAWAALVTAWILVRRGYPMHVSTIFSCVIALSVAWELFEVAAGVPREANFFFDTTLDLVMDVSGGILGYLVAQQFTRADTLDSTRRDAPGSSESQ